MPCIGEVGPLGPGEPAFPQLLFSRRTAEETVWGSGEAWGFQASYPRVGNRPNAPPTRVLRSLDSSEWQLRFIQGSCMVAFERG